MKVSFLDFVAPYAELKPELDEAYFRFMQWAMVSSGAGSRGLSAGFRGLLRCKALHRRREWARSPPSYSAGNGHRRGR